MADCIRPALVSDLGRFHGDNCDYYVAIMAAPMTPITIRNLDPVIKERPRVRAAEHGYSMEAEGRRILRGALGQRIGQSCNLYERIHGRFAAIGGVALDLPARTTAREPPRFD